MALTFTPDFISNSTNGQLILVTATASPGQAIHTVQATTTDAREEVRITIYNDATATAIITLEWGSTDIGSRLIRHVAARQTGMRTLNNIGPLLLSGTTSIVRAYSTATDINVIKLGGTVNRAT